MNTEQTVDSGTHGLRWGLIIGVVYAFLVFLRYYFGSGNVLTFSLLTYVGFPIVLVLLFLCGRQLRIANGGYIEMREAFKTMFIAVLIFEAFYMLVTFVYLKYVDPNFFEKLRESTENLMIAAKTPQKDIDKMLGSLDQVQEQSKQVGVLDLFKTYLYSVGITGLFALLFAFIIKRKPPVFGKDEFLQS
jgi:hypothetical protein